VENKLYHIPRSIMPPLKTYEIEVGVIQRKEFFINIRDIE
jgi:hypothetical protein